MGGLAARVITAADIGRTTCVLFSRMWWHLSTILPLPQRVPNLCGFPKSVCISINDEVCHGVPNHMRALTTGDIVNIDVTVVTPAGFHGDTSMMWHVGHLPLDRADEPSNGTVDPARHLALVARECLFLGLRVVAPSVPLARIGQVISAHAH